MSRRTMSNKISIDLKDIIEELKENEGDACITVVLSEANLMLRSNNREDRTRVAISFNEIERATLGKAV